jgi:hypothetical protein
MTPLVLRLLLIGPYLIITLVGRWVTGFKDFLR